MRPLPPIAIAAAVTLTAAAALPALTQAQATHHTWKKANIDTAAMSASMSAQNPNAFAPSTGDQQPGAISAGAQTNTSTQTAPAQDEAAATGAHHRKTGKHKMAMHKPKAGEAPATPPSTETQTPPPASDTQTPGAINSGASTSSSPGNMPPENGMSNTTGTDKTAPANSATSPDASKAMTTPPAGSSSSSQ